MKLIECVPNFSEGRRPEITLAIRNSIAAVEGVTILDSSSDASHNRSVITFVVPAHHAVEAAFAGMREASALIDLRLHTGEHPRIGATDVVPFVPLEDATMDDCVALARQLGERVGRELAIPVYLYERAATRPSRVNLADVRRGQFEGLAGEIGANAEREPDFGPNRIHPSAGATAIGARPFLVAYNVYLGGAENLGLAKAIAKSVRGSSGGFKAVKGLGLEVDGQAQVSMNLVDTNETPLHVAYDFIARKARAEGIEVTWSEIIGLVPDQVLFEASSNFLRLRNFSQDQVLERQVSLAIRANATVESLQGSVAGGDDAAIAGSSAGAPNGIVASDEDRAVAGIDDETALDAFLIAVGSADPVPGGGSVVAYAGALGAALTRMVAGLTIGKKRYSDVEDEMTAIASGSAALAKALSTLVKKDATAYAAVSAAYKLPKDTSDGATRRKEAIDTALIGAAEIPLETARACAQVAELGATVAARGNSNAITDAGVAALLAEAACRGAAYNVRVNVMSLTDTSRGEQLAREASELVRATSLYASAASAAVERALTK